MEQDKKPSHATVSLKCPPQHLYTWFIDVDVAVHHAGHEHQVPHILNPAPTFRGYREGERFGGGSLPTPTMQPTQKTTKKNIKYHVKF